jgi:hypothetical protein
MSRKIAAQEQFARVPRPTANLQHQARRYGVDPDKVISGGTVQMPQRGKRRSPKAAAPRPRDRSKRGAGERWPKTFSGCPLTTGCRTGILYPERQWSLAGQRVAFRGLRASVSPTPCVADLSAAPRMDRNLADLQICISRHRRVDGKSSTGFGANCSEARLLLLLGGDLALGRRLLLRGGLRLRCFLHHTALLVRA